MHKEIDYNAIINAVLAQTSPQKRRSSTKTVLPMTSLLVGEHGGVSTKALQRHFTSGATKHTITATTGDMQPPLNETAFYIDCALEAPIINAALGIGRSFMDVIPNRMTSNRDTKHGFVTSVDFSTDGIIQDAPCDPAAQINGDIESCKMRFPLGRFEVRSKTGELNDLVQDACRGQYDDFYYVGSVRGVSARPDGLMSRSDRSLIIDGAVMKQLKMMGMQTQAWHRTQFWVGDPTDAGVNPAGGGRASFWGLLNTINDDYPGTFPGYLEATAGADCSALNSDVKDFAFECMGGGVSAIYDVMSEADHTVMLRANLTQLTRDNLWIVMHPNLWKAFYETLPCEMVSVGCSTGTVKLTDGASGMFNFNAQRELQNTRIVNLNGNLYRVFLDDAMPINRISEGVYEGPIIGLPTVVSGEQVVFTETLDYRETENQLEPISDIWSESVGWTDGGKFMHTIERLKWCFEMNMKVQPRVINKAPHLMWRIDNVRACYLQDKPVAEFHQ